MAHTTPTIQENRLLYWNSAGEQQILVDSPAWYAWLETATSFAFHTVQSSFTARRERTSNRRGGWYWKAYSRRAGKLRHAYLGKSEVLTLERLQTVAEEFTLYKKEEPTSVFAQNDEATFSLSTQETITLQQAHMLDDIIGREQEIGVTKELLQKPEVRLLTITGPGGVGKTRFALHIIKVLADSFRDGIYSASLATITDPALVIMAIAQTFGFVKSGNEPLFSRLIEYLGKKQLLLLLDNFEQVIAAAPLLVELAAACPELKLLVTSRETLHLRIEHELKLPTLALPDGQSPLTLEQISRYPAIHLFLQRARAVQADFHITTANAATICEICTRLDGLPLAIELAAARSKLLSPSALLARLDHRLQVLTHGARDLPGRQQTLRATIAWSYDLLADEEQWLFRHLSVFVGGCTLDETEQFYQSIQYRDIPILDSIASLIDKNLLQRTEKSTGDVDFTMLETIREYGLECLIANKEDFQAHKGHALYYLSRVKQAAEQIRTVHQDTWLNRLERDYANLCEALHWLVEQGRQEEALSMCGMLWHFWLIRDRQEEGYQWCERVLASRTDTPIAAEIRAGAVYGTGVLADSQGHYQRAEELWEESLTLYSQVNDQQGFIATLNKLGRAAARNAPARAHDLYQQSLALARQWEDPYCEADALMSLADEALDAEDYNRARALFDESLAIFTALNDTRSRAYCLAGLGHIATSESKHEEAYRVLTESLALYRDIGDRINIAFGLVSQGMTTLYLGDYSAAHHLFEESLTVSKELGNQNEIAGYLGTLGEVAVEQKDEQDSARVLFEESLAIFRETGNEEGIASKLFALGSFELGQGNHTASRKLLDECEMLYRKLGNRAMRAATLQLSGHLAAHQGNYALAQTFMEESVMITRQIGDHRVMSSRLAHLGLVFLNQEKFIEARPLFQESVSLARECGDSRYIAEALGIFSLLYLKEQNYAIAQACLEESRRISERRNDRTSLSYRLADLATLAIYQGQMEQARPFIDEALSISLQLGNRWFVASCMERLGEIEAGIEYFSRAVELWGCAAAIRDSISSPMPPIEHAPYNYAVSLAQNHLSEAEFQALWQCGYRKRPEQLLTISEQPETFQMPSPALHQFPRASAFPLQEESKLTNREVEVLRLVAKGFTNIQIAERLVISPRTVQTHLSSIYTKISVSSRSAATRYALEHHLE